MQSSTKLTECSTHVEHADKVASELKSQAGQFSVDIMPVVTSKLIQPPSVPDLADKAKNLATGSGAQGLSSTSQFLHSCR